MFSIILKFNLFYLQMKISFFKKIISLIILLIFHNNTFSQEIEAEIDLNNCTNDKVHVILNIHNFKFEDSIVYHFPKTVPGLYSTIDFGKFIKDFKAFGNSGKLIATRKNANNEYIIINGQNLSKIEYNLEDSWDEEISNNSIFEPAGTRFEENEFFMLNLYAIVGYFDFNTSMKYEISIKKPLNLDFITANKSSKINNNTSIFNFNNFNELSTEPIIYSHLDTISFNTNNCTYIINTYSENKQINSSLFLDTIKSVIEAINFHFKNFNIQKYYINLVFENWIEIRGGGMEHKNSTVIVLSNRIRYENLFFSIKEKIAHEYLHLIAPLNLQSSITNNFDFSGTINTELLWLYEGVPEYLSMKILLEKKLISESKFLKEIGCKIYDNEKMNDKNYSLVLLSKNILNDSLSGFFLNFYYRGALTAFAYDIWLQKQTNQEYNLTTLIKDLFNENKSQPFEESGIYSSIEKFSKTHNSEFIDLYVKGNKILPLKQFFKEVDLELIDSLKTTYYVLRYYITNKNSIQEINNNIYFIPDSSKNIFENDTAKILEINHEIINKNKTVQNLMYANNNKFLNVKYEINNKILQSDFRTLVFAGVNKYYSILNTNESANNKFIEFIKN